MAKKKKRNPHKLFEIAYDKAAKIQPGGRNTLTKLGEMVLRKYLYRPLVLVGCMMCAHPTRDRARPGFPVETRLCGPCSLGKKGFWDADL